ncbi:hypothetical protein SD71_16675 [Cohnella kolymensis]|uniref:Copper amine oxidase-like N-terminal domain-containing protein n=1 Tax=Cohnella kolymensis TaxID=1590652 RepID=A0ABR5A0X3_9BACL|nr:hypothetical protein [Cohnella kolymensis]KIL34708.1 hypothetical protein SD71_16675 [Cohnella kolymensis]
MQKVLLSLAVVLLGLLPFSFVEANHNDYTPVTQSSETHPAYIDRIFTADGKTYIAADFIEWYEGEEADRVFREREQDPEMTEAPDGYYIVNDVSELQTFELSPDAEVFMQLYNRNGNIDEADPVWNEKIDVTKFVSLFGPNEEMNMKDFPYHLVIENNKIVKITQQFIP